MVTVTGQRAFGDLWVAAATLKELSQGFSAGKGAIVVIEWTQKGTCSQARCTEEITASGAAADLYRGLALDDGVREVDPQRNKSAAASTSSINNAATFEVWTRVGWSSPEAKR